MQLKKYTLLLLTSLALVACLKEEPLTSDTPTPSDGPVTVGFWMGNGNPDNNPDTTRTSINEDGRTVSWSSGDKVALWAKDGNSYTFSNQTFTHWFTTANNSQAFFTTTLASAMPAKNTDNSDITYTYYATYPVPSSVSGSGTTATFTIPSTQDGKMGGGADIMVAQSEGSALTTLDEDEDFVIDRPANYPSFTMQHLIHALRFYVPEGNWGFPEGETIERIVFTMPSAAAGTASVDIADENPALGTLSGGSNTIALNLIDPIGASTADSNGNITYDYAVAAIMPPSIKFGDDDKMIVKVYSQTKAAQQEISLSGRGAGAKNDKMQMAAGHVTPVALNCSNAVSQYYLRFSYGGNNLGEPVTAIRVKYTDENGTQQTLPIPVDQFAKEGGFYDVDLTDWDTTTNFGALRTALKNQTVTVEYESEHAIVSNTANLGDTTQPGICNVILTIPYLFFEDFSSIGNFTDDHDDANVGFNLDGDTYNNSMMLDDKDSQLTGWSGSHIGGSAGKSIRIMCRYESGLNSKRYYKGRVDTPAIGGIKNSAKVRIIFDYASAYNYYFTSGGDLNTPVILYMGHTNNSEAIKADSKTPNSTAPSNLSNILINGEGLSDTSGSYTDGFSTHNAVTIESATASTRLSWIVSSDIKANILGGNGNFWLYLDNIKVQIVP